MKAKMCTYVSCFLRSGPGRTVAFATFFVAAGFMLVNGPPVHAATLIGKTPNAAVYFSLPFNSLEFENPLVGTEMVLSHKVLDWRDADYAAGPPPWYDDWSVSHPSNIDGNANEIYLRQNGHSAWTTTTVPSTIVSIHLNSDDNDGLAEVQVDGVTVAWLDMYTPQCCQTVLVIVRGLANTTHTVTVKDTGVGQGGSDDVHIMGAAALAESDLKWDQPPLPATPDNVYYGWNQQSMENIPPIAADDWVCTNNLPITKIRWWGSFIGWTEPYPPYNIGAFRIRFWTDVPAGTEPGDFSHPGQQIGPEIYCQNYTCTWVGWDYDPRTGRYEACFLYEQDLRPEEWFYQNPGNGTNIYWISIEAVAPEPPYLWGWKTRPRDPDSPAPDDAVVFDPSVPWYEPIWWPDPEHSWDLAFELITQEQVTTTKWLQVPDLTPSGMDVHASFNPAAPPPYLLADDFLCTTQGPITNITIWGSWTNDLDWQEVEFTLSIHDDIPASQSPTGYSMPGALRWQMAFAPGSYRQSVYARDIDEWWLTPPNKAKFPGDHVCYQYDFDIPVQAAFYQEGTPSNPKVYWLDVQAQVNQTLPPPPVFLFGWKTCPTNWNDCAVWVNAQEPYSGNWSKLIYPAGHPHQGQPVDMAFRINQGTQMGQEIIKWSQPPLPYIPTNGYNGWNQSSIEGQQIVADDWACTNSNPVTDIHWWGSFIGWSMPGIPEQPTPTLPIGFQITIWTDVPQGANDPFSHPGTILWQIYCTNFTWEFVGWDFDPRNPLAPPEACFKWSQDLLSEEWFYQEPGRGTNIYWVSIAAVYAAGQQIDYPWGWKTRPHDINSLAPDAAVASDDVSPWGWSPIQYPPGTPWDMAFELTTKEVLTPTNDFGDAPAPYPTLLANDGARHDVGAGWVFLGNLIDAELDGQPNATATGDDINNLPDEDGVSLASLLVPGESAVIHVTASVNGFLSAWVDFGADGSWAEAGDQIFNNVPVSAGLNALAFNVPLTAARGTHTFARVRFSTGTITNYTGWAADGEVEDYRWYIEELDYGDAPDPTFPTLRANNGARHVLMRAPTGGFVCMGALIDSETNGQPNPTATGDDIANLADEDGVTLLTPLLPGQLAAVQVVASIPNGILNAWIDFGADGSWAQPGDQIAAGLVLPVAGPNVVNFMVPANAAAGSNVFARFRFSTQPGPLPFVGIAPNGEVEDYLWHIDQLDFGDAPDPTFPTLLTNNGARHVIGPLYLGAGVDAETDGQPNATATGDDLAGLDDEDGVSCPTALIANAPATIQVVSSGTGLLQGWFDFNCDGDWTDVNEQPIRDYAVAAGTNLVQIFVPNAVPGKSFARFRLSTLRGLSFTNQAPDGEVEDYAITFQSLKWNMPPEQGTEGVDVNDLVPLADDFLCQQSGPITDIHIWGSFLNDVLPAGGAGNMNITLRIYSDIPIGPGGYSQPGTVLWTRTFSPGQFNAGLAMLGTSEWWHDPSGQPPRWIPNADTNIWQFDFYIDPTNAFVQVSNTVYWLGVQYTPVAGDTNYHFGWKTTYRQFNDAACWFDTVTGGWRPLMYGDGHPKANQPPPFNQIDFAFALSTAELDWGDAPDTAAAPGYPTLAVHNGAAHVIVSGLTLGSLIDAEQDGQPDATATGDDNANLDDEDGVILPVLVPGQPDTVSVTVTGSGLLSAWIDFGADGSWAEPGDQILANVPLSTGTYLLNYNVPSNAVWGATTFARFRFSTVSNLTYTGLAPDGEVEDHLVNIHPLPHPDLGDAPDSSNHGGVNMTAYPKGGPPGTLANYPTVFGGMVGPFGPIHWNPTAVAFLGAGVSGELDADAGPDQDFINNILPATDSPDQDGADDGLVGLPILPHCGLGMINVQLSWPGLPPWPQMFLNVWCDWNRDGDWNDVMICPDGTRVPEWAGQNIAVPPGAGLITVTFKAWHPSLKKEPIWIRITLSEQMSPPPLGSFSGVAGGDGPPPGPGGPGGYQFGETEDYYITEYDDQATFDFGDAPAPYPTLLPNGARHLIVPNFMLGRQIDAEADGQPDPLALGDDNSGLADEDGVVFTTPVLVGTQACVNVFLSGPIGGLLDAWIDFDKNGSWDPTDQIFASQPLVNGVNAGLCFNVPTNAVLGTNFARFRLSSTGGLTSIGPAQDGEVEDYLVVIRQRAPLTNIIITNIVVTNITVSGTVSNVVKLQWNAQVGVQYQVQFLTTFSNTPPFLWTNVGPVFIGPANTFVGTNSVLLERYYRVMAPYVWP